MDAVRLHEFGPPENLVLEQVPDPVPGPGEVLVAVRAHGVHLLDTTLRRGEASGGPLPLPGLPTIPGREVAGVVEAVGEGVDAAWRGRRVAAHLGARPDGGGYGRRVAVTVETLHRVPDTVTAPDAIAMIGTGRTALGVLGIAQVTADDTVVVTGAAGGLGTLLVQRVLAAGARVVALVGGPRKAEVVRGLVGARDDLAVVDHRATGWLAAARGAVGPRGATLLLDGVGGDLGTGAATLVAPGGRVVIHGWASGDAADIGPGLDVRWAVGPQAPPWGDLHALAARALALAADGAWRVVTHQVPLAEAARAHRELEGRATTGKVVLV